VQKPQKGSIGDMFNGNRTEDRHPLIPSAIPSADLYIPGSGLWDSGIGNSEPRICPCNLRTARWQKGHGFGWVGMVWYGMVSDGMGT